MSATEKTKLEKNFTAVLYLFASYYFSISSFTSIIGLLFSSLPGTTSFGIGLISASNLVFSTIGILIFGYYGETIAEKYSRKHIFFITNLICVACAGLRPFSPNFFFFFFTYAIGNFSSGALIPIGYSIISDSFPPEMRGKKYGSLNFGITLGSGGGLLFGGILGNYLGNIGWRSAYIIGFVFELAAIIIYWKHGVDPIRGSSEPTYNNNNNTLALSYKITVLKFKAVLKKKSTTAILLSTLISAVATSVLNTWAIFYFTTRINYPNSLLFATLIFIIAGSGALPGSIVGGKIGDRVYQSGKINGRASLSFFGGIFGLLCFFGFYLLPFSTENTVSIIVSLIILIILGFFGFFFTTLCIGNIYAIFSEVCVPEARSTTNAINGLMYNFGGIFGQLAFSLIIERSIMSLPFTITILLIIWFLANLLWIIVFFAYPKEALLCKEELNYRMTDQK